MRQILTVLAAVLTLALTAALVGPSFVDWGARRGFVEARLSQALGAKVSLTGALDVRLLPSPRLTTEGALVEAGPGAPALRWRAGTFELSAPALMRGEWRLVAADLDGAILSLPVDVDGRPAPFSPRAGLDLAIEALTARDGVVIGVGSGGAERWRVAPVAFSGSADALTGPFHAKGEAGGVAFRLATGAADKGRLRVKLALEPGPRTPRLDFDGVVASGPTGHVYEGPATASGVVGAQETPWRASGPLRWDGAELAVDALDLRVGGDERPLAATGAARFDLARRQAKVDLTSKQIDLDRLLGADGAPASPGQALRALLATFGPAFGAPVPFPIALELAPGAVTLGGESVGDARLSAVLEPGTPIAATLSTSLPGRAKLLAVGRLEGGPAPRFQGRVSAEAGDARRLAVWLGDLLPGEFTPQVARVAVDGAVEISPVSASLRQARVALDRSTFEGEVAFTAPVGGERGRVFADLTAQALDVEAMPDVTGLAAAWPDYDASLTLEAQAVRVSRVGSEMVNVGRARLKAARSGGRIELERLALDDLGGASLAAQGRFDATGGTLRASLDAQRLGEFAALVARLAPGRWSEALLARAPRLAPAKLTLALDAGADLAPRSATLEGVAGGSRVAARLDASTAAGVAAKLDVAHDDAGALLRQIGVESRVGPGLGGGSIFASATGPAGGPFVVTAQARAPGGAKLGFDGAFDPAAFAEGKPQSLGRIWLDAADAGPLARALGLLAPDGFWRGGADVAAKLSLDPVGVNFSDLTGWALGTRLSGEGRLTPPVEASRARIDGALRMEALAMADVATLALGAPPAGAPFRKGGWSDRAFAPALGPGAPDVALDMTVAALDLGLGGGFGVSAGAATFRLATTPGQVAIQNLSAPSSTGRIEGSGSLRREGADAFFSGTAKVADAVVDAPFASARLDASLDLAGSGRNVATLIASLGGEGRAMVREARLRRAAVDVIAPVIAAVDADKLQIEEGTLARALATALDMRETPLSAQETALTLVGGVVRAAPIIVEAGQGAVTSRFAFDLKSFAPELRQSFAAPPPKAHWSGAPPRFEAEWFGAERKLDVSALTSGLAARRVAMDLERIEALEADMAERAAQLRRAKAWEFMRRREAEITAFEAEQRRLAAEAEKRKADEARRLDEQSAADRAKLPAGVGGSPAGAEGTPARQE